MPEKGVVSSTLCPHPALSHCGGRGFSSRFRECLSVWDLIIDVNSPFAHRSGPGTRAAGGAGDEGWAWSQVRPQVPSLPLSATTVSQGRAGRGRAKAEERGIGLQRPCARCISGVDALALARRSADCRQDVRQCGEDMCVGEPDHLIAGRSQECFAVGVVVALRLMDFSIELNDQAKIRAAEIDDKRTDGMLAAELEAVETPVAQRVPEDHFGSRLAPAQLARPRDVVLMPRSITVHDDSLAESGCSVMASHWRQQEPCPSGAVERGRYWQS